MELIAHFEYDAKLPQLATKLGAVALIDTGAQARALMLSLERFRELFSQHSSRMN